MKNRIHKLIFVFTALCSIPCYAQQITQTIRGQVTDHESQMPLIGAHVILVSDTTEFLGSTADENGYYILDGVSIGRHTLKVSFLGYQDRVISNIIVSSGKEVVLNIEQEESVVEMSEVQIVATQKAATINEMSTVSARTFDVEETEKYAGSRADPARMASNFAGVQGADDSRNDIIVRGNSPFGILWRLEGANIPNPNHFALTGTTGGPVNILNNKTLANSDFMTGAFPAEYGNSIAGVFDLRMRNGNDRKHEFTGQFGFLGTELMAEGPISKDKRYSYMAVYRYSTTAIFHAFGIDIGTSAVPKYQDGSFKVNFPNAKGNSNFAIFGVGGKSDIDIVVSNQKELSKEIYSQKDRNQLFGAYSGIAGANYTKSFNNNTFAKITIYAASANQHSFHELVYRAVDSTGFFNTNAKDGGPYDSIKPKLFYDFKETKLGMSFFVNRKIGKKHTVKSGAFIERYQFNAIDSNRNELTNLFETRWDYRGGAFYIQPYFQWKYNVSDDLILSAGLNAQLFTLNNNSASVEPRLGIKWKLKPSQALSFGFGMHSQMLPAYIYVTQFSASSKPHNIGLGFYKSNHYVMSYDNSMSDNFRIKIETYYQQLYKIPVDKNPSSFSILNQGTGFERFFPDTLVNKGTGYNYGIEVTAEKFFSKGYYYMATLSLFNSKYKGSDNILRDSDFNGHYVFNALGGKEFRVGKNKISTFGIGGKLTTSGGKRYTPIDTTASMSTNEIIYIDSLRNTLQLRDYFRFDINIKYKINRKKLTHEIGIDLVNIMNTKNVLKLTLTSDPKAPIVEQYQLGFLPLFYYRADF